MAETNYTNPDTILDDTGILSANNFIFSRVKKLSSFASIGTCFMFNGLALMICMEGQAKVKINYKVFEVNKNQILLIMPSQIITLLGETEESYIATIFIGNDHLSYSPVFNIDFDGLVQLGNYPLLTLTDKEMQNLMELHSVILTRYENLNNPYSKLCIGGLIFSFLAEIGSIYEKSKPATFTTIPTRREKITEEFFKLLLNHFQTERSVVFYADKLCLSAKYTSRVIKQATGHTIHKWINEIVIIEIKKLLKTTDKTVLEISEEMNFPNPSFFGRFFKQYVGMTPIQFRLKD